MLTIIPDLLSPSDRKRIVSRLAEAAYVDGKSTARGRAREVKQNLQLDKKQFDEGAALAKEIQDALKAHPEFKRAVRPRHIRPPLFSRYLPGMQYGLHVDKALMGKDSNIRSDVSVTVFLSPPDGYEGGELYIESPFGPQEVKLPAGSAVCYPSSTLHRVNPVVKGERLAAVTWVQSHLRSAEDRELVSDVELIFEKLKVTCPEAVETDLAQKTLANLLRRLAEA
ncbi:MAG: Fe2+-dependent dioxygenase [Limibacillus sp.]|jgi:PKHD-type hydroxylase